MPISEKRRIAIAHQGYVPTYRVRLFELINENRDREYVVFHGNPPGRIAAKAASPPFSFPTHWTNNHEIRILNWTAIYQPIVKDILTGGYSAVVLGHELKFLSNLALALLCKARGIAVVYWGFGYHVPIDSSLSTTAPKALARTASISKNVLSKLADGYLVYTKAGADSLAQSGFPPDRIFVLSNTIDTSAQIKLHECAQSLSMEQIRSQLGLAIDSVVLVFVGRLLAGKQIEVLIEAAKLINSRRGGHSRLEVVIIGSGPEEGKLKRLANSNIHFAGEIYDQWIVALYMRVAAAVVIPGFVGLAVNHAFSQGRPVITRAHDLHSPEFEYIRHNENGLVLSNDFDAFVSELGDFVDDPGLQKKLAAGALESRASMSMEAMAEQFDKAIELTIRRKLKIGSLG